MEENLKVFYSSGIAGSENSLQQVTNYPTSIGPNTLQQENAKVFHSAITRSEKCLQNDLYNLVAVAPAVPTPKHVAQEHHCDFVPNLQKHYIPKKKSRVKVRTVRNIRDLYEKDIYVDLPSELERQHNILIRKIVAGSSRYESTKTLAKSMLNCEKPISRSAWQMLMNINPEGHSNNFQFVLWNGRKIRVNGSKGGKNKFICKYDLGRRNISKNKVATKPVCSNKKFLLRNSLTVKFKPGPLTKKNELDDSYQKYNVGSVKLLDLPKPGLEIQPTYGVVLVPTISNFLQNLRDEDGIISEKWAELATSVVGSLRNQQLIQNPDSRVTFSLNYKCDQKRLLMRCDADEKDNINDFKEARVLSDTFSDPEKVPQEIKTVVENLLDTVEISLNEDNFYTGEDEPRQDIEKDEYKEVNPNVPVRDKVVKRKYCELDRLAVTVIRLPNAPQEENTLKCSNAFCKLGCICASLQCVYNLKEHCGRIECMFQCRCDFSKYKITDTIENDCPELIPGLLNLNNKINLNLAKEEQKFHQTVVVTGDKSILLKSDRRNWKASKKYGDFYNHMCLKSELKAQPILSIVDRRIDCKNIEPWCMIHNLYKCFCKGRFTYNSMATKDMEEKEINETITHDSNLNEKDRIDKKIETDRKTCKRASTENTVNPKKYSVSDGGDVSELEFVLNHLDEKCARTKPYNGRKFVDSYYTATHQKIAELEKNDQTLRQRMLSLMNAAHDSAEAKGLDGIEQNVCTSDEKQVSTVNDNSYSLDINHPVLDCTSSKPKPNEEKQKISTQVSSKPKPNEEKQKISTQVSTEKKISTFTPFAKPYTDSKSKFISWLEQSYKQYKQRMEQGHAKNTLDPPKQGKVVIYPWDFILSRYRERKNLFLISKQSPFRIFMAVSMNNDFFRNCINIDEIGMADLHQYPLTVKNLLTNASNDKNDFCILCGLSHCWEIIGSVKKLKESETTTTASGLMTKGTQPPNSSTLSFSNNENIDFFANESDNSRCSSTNTSNEDSENQSTEKQNSGTYKWFLMTVENDFSEIQFYKRGFFVKREAILKIIRVAKMSGKTVKLSSQKYIDNKTGLQFGIYAVPDTTYSCVFVGPYDHNEPLGIDMVKMPNYNKPNLTRGIWITTKASDNFKLIENPSSFMPSKDISSEEMIIVSRTRNESTNKNVQKIVTKSPDRATNNDTNTKSPDRTSNTKTSTNISPINSSPQKKYKPIKISKTQCTKLFQLASATIIPNQATIASPVPINTNESLRLKDLLTRSSGSAVLPLVKLPTKSKTSTVTSRDVYMVDASQPPLLLESKKPIAEIAPQIKIVDVYSQATNVASSESSKKSERGMLILKPEEINKRLMENKLNCSASELVPIAKPATVKEEDIDQDIENYLATSAEYIPPNADIFEISDDEEEPVNHRDVFIECTNIENLGLIRGRMNSENKLSFEFPGFKFTEFYKEEEAFTKINQVFSRKIYVPKNVNIEWHVVESESDLKASHFLKAEDLGIDFVLTKRGLRHKRDLLAQTTKAKPNVPKTYFNVSPKTRISAESVFNIESHVEKAADELNTIEEKSKTLEEEGDSLMNEIAKTGGLLRTITQVSELRPDRREEIVEALQNIMSKNE